MVVKFLSKYILEVIPSIVATVVGAYIVTHYINTKSDTDKPKAEVAAPANVAKDANVAEPAKAAEAPAPKPTKSEAKSESAKADTETAAEPAAEPRRRQPVFREKAAAKPAVVVPAEAKVEDTRDANEIAREAIARLRNSDPTPVNETQRAQEAVRIQETPRQQERTRVNVTYAPAAPVQSPVQTPPVVQALPPAANAVPPLNEVTVAPAPQPPVARADESFHPLPPADIPSRPLDLRAKERTSVAEEVVSTAKSVFHAVIPGIN
jgi:hypothetical protein